MRFLSNAFLSGLAGADPVLRGAALGRHLAHDFKSLLGLANRLKDHGRVKFIKMRHGHVPLIQEDEKRFCRVRQKRDF